MQIIKITLLTLFILANSANFSCSNLTDWDNNEEIHGVLKATLDFLTKDEESRGGIVDSIFVLCSHQITIVDEARGNSGSGHCNIPIYNDPRIKIVDHWPDIEARSRTETVSRYYFFECDTIALAKEVVYTKVKWSTIGATTGIKYVFDRASLDLLGKEYLELVQY